MAATVETPADGTRVVNNEENDDAEDRKITLKLEMESAIAARFRSGIIVELKRVVSKIEGKNNKNEMSPIKVLKLGEDEARQRDGGKLKY
ncbi:hypothetical protein Tcan_14351 [Toxocara canis]|uniref:Uncharacterized protein n=1 Tax=Toxocara canis TaxID=6265 RepID=A0A0B2UNS8_TOXCA|nr:hypothetical protein Tcan_14351 [Toxocara canis]